jgi:hypothetical protein
MKTLISSVFLILTILMGCKSRQSAEISNGVYKKEGVAIFAPTLNATYFFPFKNDQGNFELKDFMNHEYDTGFIITWYQAKWRDDILDSYSMTLQGDNTFKEVAYVTVEYSPLKIYPRDSTYSFVFEFSGITKTFLYDDKDREFRSIQGLK